MGNALQTLNIVVSHARCNKCLDGSTAVSQTVMYMLYDGGGGLNLL